MDGTGLGGGAGETTAWVPAFKVFLGHIQTWKEGLCCAQNAKYSWPGPTRSCMIWLLTRSLIFLITPCLSDYILITLASFLTLKTLSPFLLLGHPIGSVSFMAISLLCQLQDSDISLPLSQSGFSQLLFITHTCKHLD